jgi:hypothetical protein
MTGQEKIQRGYTIAVRAFPDAAGVYVVSYVPLGLLQSRPSGKAKKIPEYRATVNVLNAAVPASWEDQPLETEVTVEEFEVDARRRARLAHDWLTLLGELIGTVEGYVKELGWSTKRIEKPMEDSEIGKYSAPALLLQEETTKVLLEPIARTAPGTEGVVDLYFMPGYDDIASLYYYGKKWHLHYLAAEQKAVANPREVEAKPLTRASLRKVLAEMKVNAQ